VSLYSVFILNQLSLYINCYLSSVWLPFWVSRNIESANEIR